MALIKQMAWSLSEHSISKHTVLFATECCVKPEVNATKWPVVSWELPLWNVTVASCPYVHHHGYIITVLHYIIKQWIYAMLWIALLTFTTWVSGWLLRDVNDSQWYFKLLQLIP